MNDEAGAFLRQLQEAGSALSQASAAEDWPAMARWDLVIRQLLTRPRPEHPAVRIAVERLAATHQQALTAAQAEYERLDAQMKHVAGNREALLGYGEIMGGMME